MLAGRLIDELAEAEHLAEKGEVVLDPSALASLGDLVNLSDVAPDDGQTGQCVGVLHASGSMSMKPRSSRQPSALNEALVRPWLLPAVYERLRTGRGEFLAELRSAYPMFVRFGGIDYDDDPEAVGKLDDFVRRAQQHPRRRTAATCCS